MIIRYPPIPRHPLDDAGSEGESSTVATNSERKRPQCARPSRGRAVRFDEEANQVYRTSRKQTAPVFCCWYSEQDIHAMKRQAKKDAQQIATSGSSGGGLYRRAVKSLLDHCQEAALTGTSPQSLTSTERKALQVHCELIGLERWMSRLRAEKHTRQLGLHRVMRSQRNPETIRWQCERLSLTSRLLAFHLAVIQCE